MERTPHVSLEFKKLPIPAKLVFGRNIVTEMTTNVAQFATPDVGLPVITNLCDVLDTAAQEARGGDHEKIAAMNFIEKTFDSTLTTEAHYVDRIAAGIAAVILLSGFKATASVTSPTVPCAAATNVKGVTSLTIPGGAHVQCDVIDSAVSYQYFFATTSDPIIFTGGFLSLAANPTVVAFGADTHNKFDVTGLPSRATIYLTIIGINRAGIGASNAPVSFRTL